MRLRASVVAMALVAVVGTPAGAVEPTITGFSPTQGTVGTTVTITGSGFTGATEVAFNGTPDPTFAVDEDTQITATVPEGATTGPITVTTPDGTATSSFDFTVLVPPEITGFSPGRGPVGALVSIRGNGFTGASAVSFNGVSASFAVESDLRISSTVPDGATTGAISVTTGEGVASSSRRFVVQPNIVLVVSDDQRWDTLWAMPTVQAELVDKGVTFTNAFVVNPLCCPSRVSTLTGRYSHTTGVYTNNLPYGGFEAFTEDGDTVAAWLDSVGYRTALVGKYLNGYPEDGTYVPPGWDRWVGLAEPQGQYYDYTLNIDGALESHGAEAVDYSTDVFSGYASSFVNSVPSGEPLFLYFAPYAPHAPATPAPRHAGAFAALEPFRPPSHDEEDVSDKPEYIRAIGRLSSSEMSAIDSLRRSQYESLLSVDDAVASILDALESTGRLSSTLFLFTSDNGYLWGEHRWRGKTIAYEESIRVPFVVRYDPVLGGSTTWGGLALNIDIAPTLADAAGARKNGLVDGRRLLPLVTSGATGRGDFLVEGLERVKEGEPISPSYCAVRTKSRLFVRYATGEEELYGLPSDPFELRNRAYAASRQGTAAAMRDRLRVLCDPLPPGMDPF